MVLVCFGVLGVGAMRVEAIRLPLLELLVGEQESYTEVAFPSLEDNSTFRGEIQDYLPTYLPEGYQLESVEEDEPGKNKKTNAYELNNISPDPLHNTAASSPPPQPPQGPCKRDSPQYPQAAAGRAPLHLPLPSLWD